MRQVGAGGCFGRLWLWWAGAVQAVRALVARGTHTVLRVPGMLPFMLPRAHFDQRSPFCCSSPGHTTGPYEFITYKKTQGECETVS